VIVILSSELITESPVFEHMFRKLFIILWHLFTSEGGIVFMKNNQLIPLLKIVLSKISKN
jgi:hypothetical protein